MTVAVIVLAVALAGAIIGLIAAGVRASSAANGERAAMAVAGIANRTQLAAELERDHERAARVEAETEATNNKTAFVTLQRMANAEREEINRRVQAHLDSGSAADASQFLTGLLAAPLPGVAVDAGDAGSGGSGHTEPAAVSPAVVAPSGDVRRGA